MVADRKHGLWAGTAVALILIGFAAYTGLTSAPDQTLAATPSDAATEAGDRLAGSPTLSSGQGAAASPPPAADDGENPVAPAVQDPGPRLDVVRIEPDGAAVLAGRAQADSTVRLELDGQEIGTAQTDRDGNFVALLDLPVADAPQVLTLQSEAAEGEVRRSAEDIIIAPPVESVSQDASRAPDAETVQASRGPQDDPEDAAQTGGLDDGAVAIDQPGLPPAAPPSAEPTAQDQTQGLTTQPTQPTQPTQTALSDHPPAVLERPEQPPAQIAGSTAAPAVPGQATAPALAQPGPLGRPRIFRAGPEGLRLHAAPTAGPEAAQTLGLDAIAYNDAGIVQLTGRGAEDTQLRVYLDGRPVQSVTVNAGGVWASPLPDVDEGVYTLRIDAIAQDGTVVSRIETPFQRTAPELAAAAARSTGSTALTVQPGFTLWAISEGYFGDGLQYVQIFEANRSLIRDPDLIYPGQVLTLPGEEGREQ